MRPNVNAFLSIVLLMLLSLYLFLYNVNNHLLFSSQLVMFRPLTSSKLNFTAKLIQIQSRLDEFEYLNVKRNEELQQINRLFDKLIHFSTKGRRNTSMHSDSENFTSIDSAVFANQLDLPSISMYLNQFKFHEGSLDPAFSHTGSSRQTRSISIVFGIPTVQRQLQSYLLQTLTSLISNLKDDHRSKALFVVLIGETDQQVVRQISKQIETNFVSELNEGLIEIIAPPSIYYDSIEEKRDISDPMDDPPERIHWRTKQNLDYAYLMLYCKRRGMFYVQLEDDILTKPNYFELMLNRANQLTTKSPGWLMIEFSSLGFIGKMFHCSDLGMFATFFLLFHRDKPVDWLLPNVAQVRFCPNDASNLKCRHQVQKHVHIFRPPLFQHIGVHSSMKGKVQLLKEKNFNIKSHASSLTAEQKFNLMQSKLSEEMRMKLAIRDLQSHYENPPCLITTTMSCLYATSFQELYSGASPVWLENPKQGQTLTLSFEHQPVQVNRFRLKTGTGSKRVFGRMLNASVWVRPLLRTHVGLQSMYGDPLHGYYQVQKFDLNKKGIVDCSLLHMATLHSIRLQMDGDLSYPVVFTEMWIEPKLD